MLDKGIKSRKFLITAGVVIIATMILIFGVIQPDHWVEVILYVTIAYLGAKIGEIGMKKIPERKNGVNDE